MVEEASKRTYAETKRAIQRLKAQQLSVKKVQAEMVVYRLEGHPSRIKEKITTQILQCHLC